MKFILFLVTFFAVYLAQGQNSTYIKGPTLIESVSRIASAAPGSLSASSNTNLEITGSTVVSIPLPDATTLPKGRVFFFKNTSTATSTIKDNGANTLLAMKTGNSARFVLYDNATSNGTWVVENLSGIPISLTTDVSGILPVANGGTNSSTSLNNNRVMQSSGGAVVEAPAITAARVLISDANGIPTNSSVTSTTLTYVDPTSSIQTQIDGKEPSITTLPISKGGTNNSTLGVVAGGMVYGDGSMLMETGAGSSGQVMLSAGASAPAFGAVSLSGIGVTGVLPLANGGTNKNMTAVAGGVVWTDADSQEVTAAGLSGQILQSAATAAPAWTTATYPATATGTGTILRANGTNWVATSATYPTTTTINQILYSSSANVIAGLATANTGALVTDSSGVPSLTSGGTANRLLRTDGTTVSFAQAALATDVSGTLPIANGGTNNGSLGVAAGGIYYGDGSKVVQIAAGTTGQALVSGGTGAPTWFAPTAGSVLFAGTSGILQQDNTGLFYDDSSNFLGVGVASPQSKIHVDAGNATAGNMRFTAGTTTGVTSADGFKIGVLSNGNADLMQLENLDMLFSTNGAQAFRIKSTGSVLIQNSTAAALATSATNGFLYISSSAGAPTGTPTSQGASFPIHIDTTNSRFYSNPAGTWLAAAHAHEGDINYVQNFWAEAGTTGWATYADAGGVAPVDGTGGAPTVTWTRTTSSPLRGSGSFLFTKDAANRQGNGASFDFTIDAADKAQVLQISFDYSIASGTYSGGSSSTDSDIEAYVYDVTNAVVTQIAPYKLDGGVTGITYRFKGEYQTASNSTSYRLILHAATTSASAYTVSFDNFRVKPNPTTIGSLLVDPVAYSPTISAGFGTTSTSAFTYARYGKYLIGQGYFTTGTVAGSLASFTLPAGLSIDATATGLNRANTTANPGHIVGEYAQNSAGNTGYLVTATGTDATKIYFGAINANADNQTPQNGSSISANSGAVAVKFIVPISGWASNAVASADTDTRVIIAKYRLSANTAFTSSQNVNYDTKVYDTHNAVTTGASWVFTAPVAGYYWVSTYSQLTTAAGSRFDVYKNGSFDSTLADNNSNGGSGAAGATIVQCAAGDTIALRGSNASYTLVGGSSSTGAAAIISIERVNGPSQILASEKIAAKAHASGTTSLTSGSFVGINMATTDYDTHGAISSPSSITRFTAPSPGFYHVDAAAAIALSATSATNMVIAIYKNGVEFSHVETADNNAGQNQLGGIASDVLSLLAGDRIEMFVKINQTGLTTKGDIGTYLTVYRIGN